MTLTSGFTKSCTLKTSGLKEIHIVAVGGVTSFTLTGEIYTAAIMSGGAVFKKYEFEKGEAEMKEDSTSVNGNVEVVHTIQFFLSRMNEASRIAVQEIMNESNCGMISIVTDNNNVKWIYGYSENFLTDEPLKLDTSASTSGKAKTDVAGRDQNLLSSDNELARTATFTIPV